MGLSAQQRTRIVIGVLVIAAVAALVDGVHLWRLHRWNTAIAADPPVAAGNPPPAELQFALAHAQAASGATDEALKRYRTLQGDTPLGQAARYNSANLLMRQAIDVRGGTQPGLAIPLLELAKEGYREVLRNDPGQWEARYNLERAQRLLPDPDESLAEPADGRRDAERAVTTMRGYSPGLP